MRIKKISKEKYSGYVYNFGVEDDETYYANGICVHNCRCTKIPITLGYMTANNVKWDKKPGKKTLDMVGKDFRNNPKSLKDYSDRINKRLVDLEKTNIDLNEMLKKQNN